MSKLIETLNEQVVAKGKEVNEYREKYNIRIQGEDLPGVAKTSTLENADGDNLENDDSHAHGQSSGSLAG